MINLFCFTSFLANRKTIKLLFPEEAEERQKFQELLPDYKSLITKFESLNIKHQRQSSVNLPKIIFVTVSIFGIAIVSKASSKKKDEVLCKSHLGFKKILVSSGLSCPPNLGEK